MTLDAAVSLVVLSLSGWSALALLLDSRGPARVNRRLALVILLVCLPQAYDVTRVLVGSPTAALLGLASQAALWLEGPLLLSMTRLVVGHASPREWWHYLAFPTALVGMTFSPSASLEWGLAGTGSLFVYLLVSLRDLHRGRARLALIHAAYRHSAYWWLLFVVAGLLALAGLDLAILGGARVNRAFPVDFIEVTHWLAASYFVVIAFCSVYRPRRFFRDRPAPAVEPVAPATVEAGPSERDLDESRAETLSRRLAELMEREQLFRRHDLSLAHLAARLGVRGSQASELLAVHLGQPFDEYIRGWRLWHASQLLADARGEPRLRDIAFEAGFGNPGSFCRSFRDAYGITPREFRRRRRHGGEPAPAATLAAQSQNPG